MTRTVVALFADFQAANEAVRELVENGYPRDQISLLSQQNEKVEVDKGTDQGEDEKVLGGGEAGAGVGAGIGAAIGVVGGLLAGMGALAIPGIGVVLAAGPLALALSALTGAGVGAVAGGFTGSLLGALIGLGIPEEEAAFYAEGVRRGQVLVTVEANSYSADQILGFLNQHHPVNIHQQDQKINYSDPEYLPNE